jgi:hypothetical protein
MAPRSSDPDLTPERLIELMCAGKAPETPKTLHTLLATVFNIEIPTEPLVEGSTAPFDYIVHAFFEGTVSPREPGVRTRLMNPIVTPADAVVWAARGAGKTFLGAVATTLDLLFKPRIDIRILGGSLEQSQRMHEHLRRLFEHPAVASLLGERITERRVIMRNGARAQVLAQSQTSVRGTRVQKLRCDEVELFDPDVWHAAQLTTRSMRLAGPWGTTIRGSIEALSTMHRPHGLMWNLVADASEAAPPRAAGAVPRRIVFRWGLIDAMERCPAARACETCALHPECAGRAKGRGSKRGSPGGHVAIDDALRMKRRVSIAVWESEMLCLRPRRTDCVFPEFSIDAHVGDWTPPEAAEHQAPPHPDADRLPAFALEPRARPERRRWVVGMDFGIRAPTVAILAWYRDDDPERVLHVEAEHVRTDWTVEQHARVLLGDPGEHPHGWPPPPPPIDFVGVDPAGHQRSDQTGISSIAALRKAGLGVRSRRLPLHQGLDLVRARLRPAASVAPSTEAGPSPRLFIHRRCVKLIESLSRYHFPEDRPESLDPVKDGSDHAVDALRYLVVCLDRPHEAKLSAY